MKKKLEAVSNIIRMQEIAVQELAICGELIDKTKDTSKLLEYKVRSSYWEGWYDALDKTRKEILVSLKFSN